MEQIANTKGIIPFPDVYLVYYTNNESYDDYAEYNLGITLSEEAAKEAVRKLSLVEDIYSADNELYPDEMTYEQRRESCPDVMIEVLKELGASSSVDINQLLGNISGAFEYVKLPMLKQNTSKNYDKIVELLLEIMKEHFSQKGTPLLEKELVYFHKEKQ